MKNFDWSSIQGCFTGAFISSPWQGIQCHPSKEEIDSFEKKIQKKLAIVMTFLAWGSPKSLAPFPESWCSMVSKRGSMPMLTWEPWDQKIECPDYRLDKILSGRWDSYLCQWADSIRQWGQPLLIRWAHEMNGTWYPWDGIHNDSDPTRYIETFRYVVNVFRDRKCSNVFWVWCPEMVLHLPRNGGPHDYTLYYPGDSFVDWIGFDGYNFGTAGERRDPWRSFDEIFGEAYQRMMAIAPAKPIMIAEFACGEGGGSKPQWVLETFKSIRQYPHIKAWMWFNILKETNWIVDSSDETLKSFQESVSAGYYKERPPHNTRLC
ncbi:MAG: hypothetical protein HYS56_05730 [Candidatus Omnitrophica bacterium]|nr:hypothetical protein [Candidatus Omnitrophota bacterium]